MDEIRTTTEPRAQGLPATDEAADERVTWKAVGKYLLISVFSLFILMVVVDKIIMPWYVSLGATEQVPSVIGLGYVDAKAKLEKLGFEVKKGEPQFNDQYPAGVVIRQLPYGGSETKEGRRIHLIVSRGSEMIPMIDLLGMPVREARIKLMRMGFELGEITYDYNDTIMRDLVYAQSIPARIGTRPGATVDVMVSRGPSTRYTMMPNLVSLDIEQARIRLQNAGLVLGIVRYKEDPTYVANTVLDQGVSPYSQVAQGAAVDVTVAVPDAREEEAPEVFNLNPE